MGGGGGGHKSTIMSVTCNCIHTFTSKGIGQVVGQVTSNQALAYPEISAE
jgi:hypothetical protein